MNEKGLFLTGRYTPHHMEVMMAIHDWPAYERPREKLLKHGASTLSDAELLAIFLRTGVTGSSAVDLARHLLMQFGGLRTLLESNAHEFCRQHGLGPAKYAQLQAVLEMARRHTLEQIQRNDALQNPNDTRTYISARLRNQPSEVFACLFLDNLHRVIAMEELFKGTLDTAPVYPREVVRRCLAHNAAAVILAHNHPSGSANPSQADIHITQHLRDALALIDVRVLDHLVVGHNKVTSLAEQGQL